MEDFVGLGSSPCEEDCVQVSKDFDYMPKMKKECNRFKLGIEKYFENLIKESDVSIVIKTFPHDFGSYCDVGISFDNSNKYQYKAALKIEQECPTTWEELENGKYNK